MRSINGIIKKLMEDQIEYAEYMANEDLAERKAEYSDTIADMLFFSDLCENNPEAVEDWIYENISKEPELIERLSSCIIKKVARDSKKWLEYHNPFNTFMREMKAGA